MYIYSIYSHHIIPCVPNIPKVLPHVKPIICCFSGAPTPPPRTKMLMLAPRRSLSQRQRRQGATSLRPKPLIMVSTSKGNYPNGLILVIVKYEQIWFTQINGLVQEKICSELPGFPNLFQLIYFHGDVLWPCHTARGYLIGKHSRFHQVFTRNKCGFNVVWKKP